LTLAPPRTIVLAGETDFAGFRAAARALLAAAAQPDTVLWLTADATQAGSGNLNLFAGQADAAPPPPPRGAPGASVPKGFVTLCQWVVLHDDPQRFALLYRLLWRLVHEPALRGDPLDADLLQARQMHKAVRRDMHKMKAFVRFRTIDDSGSDGDSDGDGDRHGQGGPMHVAWFEPAHHIVQAVAPFFARRFTAMRWAILTPRQCVAWTPPDAAHPQGHLRFSPGARREHAPGPDAGEALWLTYYQNIFNPARLKLAMMQKEMPRKYWHNLPEAALITPLTAAAAERSGRMVDSPATTPARTVRLLAREPAPPPLAAGQAVPRPESMDALRAATHHCRACPIGQHATQAVCGEGPSQPALMFVGEQPGDQEDLQGRPFVGPAGQLLDRALAKLGVSRDTVYLANAVKHFKYELRGKRRIHKTASQREASACVHWLDDEIRLVRPRALVALGATAARALMGYDVAVTQTRGQWLKRADGLPVLVTLHPSALLRVAPAGQNDARRAWLADLRLALAPPA